jgi:hypothetical protein
VPQQLLALAEGLMPDDALTAALRDLLRDTRYGVKHLDMCDTVPCIGELPPSPYCTCDWAERVLDAQARVTETFGREVARVALTLGWSDEWPSGSPSPAEEQEIYAQAFSTALLAGRAALAPEKP